MAALFEDSACVMRVVVAGGLSSSILLSSPYRENTNAVVLNAISVLGGQLYVMMILDNVTMIL